MGSGMNHVKAGDSGFQGIYGNKQIGLKLDASNPTVYIDDIKRQTDGNYLFSPEEKIEVGKILQKYGVNVNVNNPGELIRSTAYNPNAKSILGEVAEATGRRSTASGSYGSSTYASTLTDFDDAIDVLEFAMKEHTSVPKSYDLRKSNLRSQSSTNTINTLKDFYKIKNLLEDGIKKAEERQTRIQKIRNDYYSNKADRVNKMVENNPILKQNKQLIEDLKNKEWQAGERKRELQKRLNRIEGIQYTLKSTGIAVGILGGMAGGIAKLASTANKNDRVRMDSSPRGLLRRYHPEVLDEYENSVRNNEEVQAIDKGTYNEDFGKKLSDRDLGMLYRRIERKAYNDISVKYRSKWDYERNFGRESEEPRSSNEGMKNGGNLRKLSNFTKQKSTANNNWLNKYSS